MGVKAGEQRDNRENFVASDVPCRLAFLYIQIHAGLTCQARAMQREYCSGYGQASARCCVFTTLLTPGVENGDWPPMFKELNY